jgi:hypothetical protein
MFVPIRDYQADWNPKTNTYRILLGIATASKPWQVPITSETEFIAVLLMLGKAGVMVDTATGDLQLPRRSVGT